MERFESSGICPPAIQVIERHGSLAYVGVVDIGNFEFSAGGRFQRPGLVEDSLVIEVNASNGVVGLRMGGLLFNANDVVAHNLGNAETLRVGNLLEEDFRARLLPVEFVNGGFDGSLNNVVAKNDADLMAFGKVFREGKRIGNAAFAFLIGVVDVLQAELTSVREQTEKVAGITAAGHNQQIAYPGFDQGLDRVVDHRLVVNRQQVLVGDLGEREKPAAGAPC